MTKNEAIEIVKATRDFVKNYPDKWILLNQAIEELSPEKDDELKIEVSIPNLRCRNCDCGEITYLNMDSFGAPRQRIYCFRCDNEHICKYLEVEE